MRAVILAGGKGARLKPYTTVIPKPLMPLDDVPVLEVVVRQLQHAGFERITMTVGHLSGLIMAFFNEGEKFKSEIDYSIEEKPLGTAGPLSLIDDLDDTFLVMNGDVLTTLDYKDLIKFHKSENALATVAMQKRNVKIDFGVITSLVDNRLVDYHEKPEHFYNVSMGIYVFEPRIKDYIESDKKLDFPELIKRLLNAEEKVIVYPSKDFWLDIGRWEDFEAAVEEFKKNREKFLPDE